MNWEGENREREMKGTKRDNYRKREKDTEKMKLRKKI